MKNFYIDLSKFLLKDKNIIDKILKLEEIFAKEVILKIQNEETKIYYEEMVLFSSILSLSNNDYHRNLAQKIAVYLSYLAQKDKNNKYILQLVNIRNGNFLPVFEEEVSKKFFVDSIEDENLRLPLDINFEIKSARKESNLKNDIVNRDNQRIFNEIDTKKLICFTAPTSFGKTFIVRKYIGSFFKESDKNILIIVPTKALIDEYIRNFIEDPDLQSEDVKLISNARTIVKREQNFKKTIFVLTQERVKYILESQIRETFLDVLGIFYIDEAQSIRKGYRGLLLQYVLKDVYKYKENNLKYIVSAPMVKNIGYFQTLFKVGNNDTFKNDFEYRTVPKILLKYKIEANEANVLIQTETKKEIEKKVQSKSLKKISLTSYPETMEPNQVLGKQKLELFTKLNLDGTTLVFASSPKIAYKNAIEISEHLRNRGSLQKQNSFFGSLAEEKDFDWFLKEVFTNKLPIIRLLKQGIGVHHGNMPTILRNKIQEYIEKEKLMWVIATSTIIEGVNMPIKNICLGNKGRNLKLTDEQNLFGRAGRSRYDLYGVVVSSGENYNEEPETIEDPVEELKKDKDKEKKIEKIIKDLEEYKTVSSDRNLFEYLVNKELEKKFDFEFFKKNNNVDYRMQRDLYNHLKNSGNLNIYLQALEIKKDRKEEIEKVLNLTHKFFFWPKKEEWITFVSTLTMGRLMGEDNIEHGIKDYNEKETIEIITKNLKNLSEIEFDYVKFYKCFFDILFDIASEGEIDIDKYRNLLDRFIVTLETGLKSEREVELFDTGIPLEIIKHLFKSEILKKIPPEKKTVDYIREQWDLITKNTSNLTKSEIKYYLRI